MTPPWALVIFGFQKGGLKGLLLLLLFWLALIRVTKCRDIGIYLSLFKPLRGRRRRLCALILVVSSPWNADIVKGPYGLLRGSQAAQGDMP